MPTPGQLASALRQFFVDAAPGGSLNPEGGSLAARLGDFKANPGSYLAAALRSAVGADTAKALISRKLNNMDAVTGSDQTNSSLQQQHDKDALNTALSALTVYHGSPHKFDKFDMSKIGTGEGAQAYGHGLYLAEAPEVAKMYKVGGQMGPEKTAQYYLTMYKTPANAIDALRAEIGVGRTADAEKYTNSVIDLLKSDKVTTGHLYKTDIPDEAVARMLDWDKPLSQQTPEVQAAIGSIEAKGTGFTYNDIVEALRAAPHLNNPKDYAWAHPSGQEIYNSLGDSMMVGNRAMGQAEATKKLKELGISGIRYLDGGSRDAGAGTSNYVLFDDQMPRILERNGQATGAQPWAPGEWSLQDIANQ